MGLGKLGKERFSFSEGIVEMICSSSCPSVMPLVSFNWLFFLRASLPALSLSLSFSCLDLESSFYNRKFSFLCFPLFPFSCHFFLSSVSFPFSPFFLGYLQSVAIYSSTPGGPPDPPFSGRPYHRMCLFLKHYHNH